MEELRLSEMYAVVWAEREVVVEEPPPRRKRAGFDARKDEKATGTGQNLASHQLIVVTHTGDWFRLGVPEGKVDDGDVGDSARGDRCEVLEYRRLRTVAAEW
jgi:hypothetical protein